MTDEQLIERLRSSMTAATAGLLPPGDLLEGISPSHRRVRWGRPSGDGLVLGFAAVSTVVIAVVAVALLGRRQTVAPRAVSPQSPQRAHSNSLPELRSQLATLRRRQRAIDKIPGWGIAIEERQHCSNCLNVTGVLRRQTRLLATIHIPRAAGPGPEHVFLVLGRVPPRWDHGLFSGWRQRGPGIGGLHLSLVGLMSRPTPHFDNFEVVLNAAQTPMPTEALNPHVVLVGSRMTVGVVPDGVTRVKWELYDPGQAHSVVVYPRVAGNVATAPWTPAPRPYPLLNEQMLVGATWYGADGRVLASFQDNLARIDRIYSGRR